MYLLFLLHSGAPVLRCDHGDLGDLGELEPLALPKAEPPPRLRRDVATPGWRRIRLSIEEGTPKKIVHNGSVRVHRR